MAAVLAFATDREEAELWVRPDVGHISVLNSGAAAMGWHLEHSIQRLSPAGQSSDR